MLFHSPAVSVPIQLKSDGGVFTKADHAYLVSVSTHIQEVYYFSYKHLAIV